MSDMNPDPQTCEPPGLYVEAANYDNPLRIRGENFEKDWKTSVEFGTLDSKGAFTSDQEVFQTPKTKTTVTPLTIDITVTVAYGSKAGGKYVQVTQYPPPNIKAPATKYGVSEIAIFSLALHVP